VAFGAFEPDFNSRTGELCFTDYHADGFRAVSNQARVVPMQPEKKEIAFEQLDAEPSEEEIRIIEGAEDMPEGKYEPKAFRKLPNIINIHSWLPLYFDYMNPQAALTPEQLPVSLGATILSQNLLSTAVGMLGYEYSDKTHYIRSGLRLKGRYPIVDMSFNYGGLPLFFRINPSDTYIVRPNRITFSANTYVPLRLNTGKFISFLQPLVAYQYTSDIFPNADRTGYEKGVHWMRYRLYISSYLRLGMRDILPRLGFTAFTSFRNAPFDKENFGTLRHTGITMYLPGPFKHQTLRLSYNSQLQEPENYLFNNELPLPRGIFNIQGLDLKLYRADFTLPLAYPDLSLEPLVYIKRIRANLWFDYLRGKDILVSEPEPGLIEKEYISYGGDILVDFHPLRVYFPFSMGARISYVPESGTIVPEFLFTIDVN
jgi:hypothetical protein